MRAFATIAVVVLVSWIAIKVVFGFAGGILGLLLGLCWFALKVLLVVGIVYWLLSVFSPETAKKIRDSFKGESL